MSIKVGIIGCGRIAARFVTEIDHAEGIDAAYVYNPHLKSAENFGGIYGIREYGADQEKMFQIVDAVYIAAPHGEHFYYAKKAMEAGKHVLCEKPAVLKKSEAEELCNLASKKGLVFMEALKTAYCPGYMDLLKTVKSGIIGRVVSVEAAFTRLTPTNCREYLDTEYRGSFTELGSYGMLPVFDILGDKYSSVSFISMKLPDGTDGYTKAEFVFSDNGQIYAEAAVKTGLSVKSEGQLLISGTKGYIIVPSPWWLTKSFEIRFEDPDRIVEHTAEFEGSGLRYEIREFTDRIYRKQSEAYKAGGHDGIIARARVMECFLSERGIRTASEEQKKKMKIWAHRGCSYKFPENTLQAFIAAAGLKGLTGIELDVQYSKDKQVVVFHDETLDRVTESSGFVREYTLDELKVVRLKGSDESIPTIAEVLEKLKPYCEKGMLINIELKTGIVRYEGIEQDTYDIVKEYGLQDSIIWSSFNVDSIRVIKQIDPHARTGMLAANFEDCVSLGRAVGCDAYHSWIGGLSAITDRVLKEAGCGRPYGLERLKRPIRAYASDEPFFIDGVKEYSGRDLRRYLSLGVTDVFTNEPERYLVDWRS